MELVIIWGICKETRNKHLQIFSGTVQITQNLCGIYRVSLDYCQHAALNWSDGSFFYVPLDCALLGLRLHEEQRQIGFLSAAAAVRCW